ncbi:BTB/POZ domain-containing protein 2-like [Contarinia nasturtii]|uniref:BTB/POZ domain-containing protein 2-like n=1 Tax=Contarinia nasturtii TaxID=265458 RepID=UPI0012D3FF1A|nr:BTB/POZ domain-containing protein 2-like [Contarinia nasturtii]
MSSHVLLEIGKKFYLGEEFADVYIVFMVNDEEVERVPAHKNILAANSDVIHTMFNESWKEKNEVKIVDADVADFKEFLRFFYFGMVNLTIENVDAIMNLSNKYNVTECKNLCRKFLKATMTSENMILRYELAIFLEDESLKKFCEVMISIDPQDFLKRPGFLQCNKNTLAALMEMKGLKCSEVELFEACMSWVKNKSEEENLTRDIVQSELGDLFYKIRFGSMTIKEFSTLIPSYGSLFSNGELQDIIQFVGDKEFQSKLFIETREKRCDVNLFEGYKKIKRNRLAPQEQSAKPYIMKNLETTTFSVNETVFLIGFKSAPLWIYNNNIYRRLTEVVPSEITIVRIPNTSDPSFNEEVVLGTGKINLESKHVKFNLSEPIMISPNFIHEIRLMQTPNEHSSTYILLKSQFQIDSDFSVQYHRDTERGIIYRLDFYRI